MCVHCSIISTAYFLHWSFTTCFTYACQTQALRVGRFAWRIQATSCCGGRVHRVNDCARSVLATSLISYPIGVVGLPFVVGCTRHACNEQPKRPDFKKISDWALLGHTRITTLAICFSASESAISILMLPAHIYGAVKQLSMDMIYLHRCFATLFESYLR